MMIVAILAPVLLVAMAVAMTVAGVQMMPTTLANLKRGGVWAAATMVVAAWQYCKGYNHRGDHGVVVAFLMIMAVMMLPVLLVVMLMMAK